MSSLGFDEEKSKYSDIWIADRFDGYDELEEFVAVSTKLIE